MINFVSDFDLKSGNVPQMNVKLVFPLNNSAPNANSALQDFQNNFDNVVAKNAPTGFSALLGPVQISSKIYRLFKTKVLNEFVILSRVVTTYFVELLL